MKKIISFCIVLLFFVQPCLALTQENPSMQNFSVEFKRQSRDQYSYKKVNKKYDTYLINLENKNKNAVLICANTELDYILNDGTKLKSETRRQVYRKTRSRDIGKSYWIGIPCSAVAGGIVGLTFGFGIPVALGVVILGNIPANNAAKINAEFAKDLYMGRKLPIRIESNQLYQVRIFIPKGEKIKKVIITDVAFENNFNKKYNLELLVDSAEDSL